VVAAVALYRSTLPDATTADLKNALLSDVDPVAALAGRAVSGGRQNLGHQGPAAGARRGRALGAPVLPTPAHLPAV